MFTVFARHLYVVYCFLLTADLRLSSTPWPTRARARTTNRIGYPLCLVVSSCSLPTSRISGTSSLGGPSNGSVTMLGIAGRLRGGVGAVRSSIDQRVGRCHVIGSSSPHRRRGPSVRLRDKPEERIGRDLIIVQGCSHGQKRGFHSVSADLGLQTRFRVGGRDVLHDPRFRGRSIGGRDSCQLDNARHRDRFAAHRIQHGAGDFPISEFAAIAGRQVLGLRFSSRHLIEIGFLSPDPVGARSFRNRHREADKLPRPAVRCAFRCSDDLAE